MKNFRSLKALTVAAALTVFVSTCGFTTASAVSADTTPPSAPSSIAWNHNTSFVTLDWSDSTDNVGVAYYELTVNDTTTGVTNVYTTTRSGYGVIGTVQHGYYVRVVAVDAAGNRSLPAAIRIPAAPSYAAGSTAADADTIPPSEPTHLTWNHNTAYLYIKWQASTDNVGVAYYEVSVYNRTTGKTATFTTTSTVYGVGIMPNTYSARVVAVDYAGNRSLGSYINIP